MKSNRIITRPVDHTLKQTLINDGVDPLLAQLFVARSVTDSRAIDTPLSALLPMTGLKNIDLASQRLSQAIAAGEKILIVADYDADGATACAVGVRGLRAMGATVDFLVPNRFEHGYGLTSAIVDMAAQLGTELLMTVDNGMGSSAGVAHARQLGMDVLITDHHLPADTLPDCLIVNPNQPEDEFVSKSLAGVGVMFYVLMALRQQLRQQNWFNPQRPEPNLAQWLDLVALGTIADVVPLDHNNRILVAQGLRRIRAGKMQPGLHALFSLAKRNPQRAQAFDLGFALGPRLNAAGRLDDMSIGIACLLADDTEQALQLATQLDQLNRQRRQIETHILQEALGQLPDIDTAKGYSTVVYQPDWHQGVIGIVAGRLRERLHRPTIVFAPADHNQLRGSGRSIEGLHLRDALDQVSKQQPELMITFGGHAMAAGLTIEADKLPEFQTVFEEVCRQRLTPDDLNQHHLTDGSLDSGYLNLTTAQQLSGYVWGQGFAEPRFCDEFEVLWQRPVGTNHLKLGLRKDTQQCEAMLFGCTDTLPDRVRLVYRLVANEWQKQWELQLYVDYWEYCA
ncbi:single-stranded-DNA-specific exonuclease RecJ [Neisseriaceae bacterium ESL0693]|nr:single-stranded-DNA-specific exonuclease RecJ [Neisseriaceae bacterium ESL0693]